MKLMELIDLDSISKSSNVLVSKRRATDKMVAYARLIASTLGLENPDFDDFDDTSKFISKYRLDYLSESHCCVDSSMVSCAEELFINE